MDLSPPAARRLRAALGFLRLAPTEPVRLLHRLLDSRTGLGLILARMQRADWDLQLPAYKPRPAAPLTRRIAAALRRNDVHARLVRTQCVAEQHGTRAADAGEIRGASIGFDGDQRHRPVPDEVASHRCARVVVRN